MSGNIDFNKPRYDNPKTPSHIVPDITGNGILALDSTLNIYKEFMAFIDTLNEVKDNNIDFEDACPHTSRQAMNYKMQQPSGDYSTHQVSDVVDNMTMMRPTQSGVDPQSQDPDSATMIPSVMCWLT